MNQLNIINQNGQLLVDSRDVAEMVGRDHNNVMKDIRRIIEQLGGQSKIAESYFIEQLGEVTSHQSYFIESSYKNSQNKELPCYLLTKKGCELYATRMTGEKGTKFAMAYIERFNEMEQQLTKPVNSLELALQAALKHEQELKIIRSDVDYLKDHMRIDGSQQHTLFEKGKRKVLEVLGGSESPAYNAVSKKAFAQLWRDFKRHFHLPRYSELPKAKFDDAVYFISKWRPSTSLEIEIENYNRQGQLI